MTDSEQPTTLTIGAAATLACILEAIAPKPGNVHRSADFADAKLIDFLASAVVIGRIFDQCQFLRVGEIVLQSIRATRDVTRTNTNLGLLLLLAPMAKTQQALDRMTSLSPRHISEQLSKLDQQDSKDIYEAIRLAQPGGLDKVEPYDVEDGSGDSIPNSIMDAMHIASEWDSIAKQYTTDFSLVLETSWPYLQATIERGLSLTDAIIITHVFLMAEVPDTLIARKCGKARSLEAAARAGKVLNIYESGDATDYLNALSDFDFWLRADGHRRNPGTTADLVGATLFVGLVQSRILPPYH